MSLWFGSLAAFSQGLEGLSDTDKLIVTKFAIRAAVDPHDQ